MTLLVTTDVLHTVTLTNGVSFSLENGACCVVLFTASSNTGTSSTATLNINSTGAKNVRTRSIDFVRIAYAGVTERHNTLLWGGWLQNMQLLVVYDGSEYTTCFSITLYSDYSD